MINLLNRRLNGTSRLFTFCLYLFILLGTFIFLFFGWNAFAITNFNDSFEDYPVGLLYGNDSWSGSTTGWKVGSVFSSTSDYLSLASNGFQSMLFHYNNGTSGIDDKVLELPVSDGSLSFYFHFTAVNDYIQLYYKESSTSTPMLVQFSGSVVRYLSSIVPYTWVDVASTTLNNWYLFQSQWRSSDEKFRFKVEDGSWTNWVSCSDCGGFSVGIDTASFLGETFSASSIYIDTLYSTQCSDYDNIYDCYYENTGSIYSTDRCEWDNVLEECHDKINTCGDFENCRYCYTKTDCHSHETCLWYPKVFNIFDYDHCEYFYKNIATTTDWYSTTSYATTQFGIVAQPYQISSLRAGLSNKVPFVYIFAFYDGIVYLVSEDYATSLQPLSLTIPEVEVSSSYGTTTIFENDLEIPIISQTFIFQILSEDTWHSLRDLLGACLYIMLFFGLQKLWKEITHIHT